MLPDDVFRAHLQSTTAELARWAESIRDVAGAVVAEGPGFWKLTVTPRTWGACPFELLLRSDQKLDITLAKETYEDRPMPSLDRFPVLVRAIADGHVVERHWRSLDTGALAIVETIITPSTGEPWRDHRLVTGDGHAAAPGPRLSMLDRHFLPFRRLTPT